MFWPVRTSNESYTMRFMVNDINIETNWNKKDNSCNAHWKGYDDSVSRLHTKNTRCNNPYQKPIKDLPMCDTQELIRRALFSEYVVDQGKYEKPCKTMENVRIEYLESTMKGVQDVGEFWFSITFPLNRFKDIKQTR